MPRGDGSARLAIGFVAGVGIALLFFVWAFPWFRDPSQNASYRERWQQEHAQQEQHSGDPHFWVRPFYGWLYAEDTLAQWLMAVFGVITAGVSLWAVMLVRDTLRANLKAVENAQEANEIAARQFAAGFKPWLVVKCSGPYVAIRKPDTFSTPAKGKDRQLPIVVTIEIINAGQVPATITKSTIFMIRNEYVFGMPQVDHVFRILEKGDSFFPPHDRPPNPSPIDTPEWTWGTVTAGVVILTESNRDDLLHDPPPIVGVVEYSDPLGKRWQFGFAFAPFHMVDRELRRWGGAAFNYDREIKEDGQRRPRPHGAAP